MLKCSLDVYFY